MSDEKTDTPAAVERYTGSALEEYRPRILLSADDAKTLDEQLRAGMRAVLNEGTDYGVIPGAGDKKVLMKPGAEKLLQWFGFGFINECTEVERDADGNKFGVTYRCTITKELGDGRKIVIATCDGYAGYDEDRYFSTEEQAREKAEKREKANASRYNRQPNPAKWEFATAYKAPWNTVIKMCLAASTPLLVKSPAGEYLTEATRLYSWLSRPTAPKVQVPGPDGEWVPVSGMFRNGTQPVLRITLRDGTEHRVTAAHRFLTLRGLVAAGDLRIGDVLTRRTIPLAGMKEPDPDFGWLVGLVIADGHVSRWGVRITLGQDEEPLAARAVWIGRRLGCPAHYEQRTDMKAWQVTISGPAIVGLLNQFIAGKQSYDKHLRATGWRAGSDFLDGVLRGWLDGDGSWTQRPAGLGYWRVGFTGHNDAWLRDLRVLGAVLGYRVNVRTGSSKAGGKTFGTFVGDVKLPASSHGNNADLSQVMSVEPDGQTMTYDLEVDTPDHLYLLHDGTVTHNSQKRAHVGATIDATAAAGLFTQDLDDDLTAGVASSELYEAGRTAVDNLPMAVGHKLNEWYQGQKWPDPAKWDTAQWVAALIEAGRLGALRNLAANLAEGEADEKAAAKAEERRQAPGPTGAAKPAAPTTAATSNPGNAAEDPAWYDSVLERAATVTEDTYKALYSELVNGWKAGQCTDAQREEAAAFIKARIDDLRGEVITGTVVTPGLEPGDPWLAKIESIISSEDADAAAADVKANKQMSSIRKDVILRAISLRRQALLAGAAA